ncbi:nuclear condensing complex subunit [Crucibulum laeve]|uniref:Nuclear condensing complex subunit n=1 Tax=Crucibulum laeve TaxID=68775 RepID=A0A5C3LP33_9AGAR|nr:nuclear condensing complex subunit [Crucibulum laeve]
MASKPSISLENIQEIIGAIFDQTQASLANHKKNCVALYKLHLQASEITHPAKNGIAVKLVGERKFGDVFIDMVNRVLVVKKGPVTADRIVKFVGGYVKFLNEKEDDDTVASRFVSRLLKWLFQGFLAKNKNVRYRCVFIVSEMISHLGEIDEDTYELLRESLMERICDKESLIRVHAVIALSKLIGSEDPDEVEDGEKTILEVLLDVVSHDPAAEVRRSALLNLPLLESTLKTILARTRDTDPLTRKLVYSSVLQLKLNHPQQLSLAQREKVIKDGLGDREPSVRVAAGKLVASWFDAVLSDKEAIQEVSWSGDDGGIMRGFISFLSLFDVVGPGEAIAVDAVLSVFVTRPEIPDMFVFSDNFWTDLSPESAVLARIFVEHCINNKHEARLETASLPVVTAFAFHIQEVYNVMLEVLQESENSRLLRVGQDDQAQDDEFEEELAKCEVVLGELLRMSLKLDYGDEIGRRKVFSVVKGMLAHPELPPGLIERCVDVLKEIMPSERDLIRVVVEIIVELRDGEDDGHEEDILVGMDESQSDITQATFRKDRSLRRSKNREQMSAEERMEADVTDIRCLMLCIAVLERVDSNFEDNSTLEGILADLIIPSVKRKELAMREKALISLGLCCLIAQNMALSSFQLFVSQVQSAPDDLKVQVLRIIFDLLIMYDHELFGHSEDISKRIVDFLLHTLEAEEAPIAQAVLCTGICKLLLTGIITDPRVLTGLVLTYVSPATLDNIEVRQCLSYFFPVYCYSSPDNQTRMQSIFLSTYDLMVRMYEERDDDQDMITPYQLGLLFVDWTNPQKAAEM